MAFNPDADANYQTFLATTKTLSGPDRDAFLQLFIQYLSKQATATGTLNATMIGNAITNAKTALRAAKNTFSFNPDTDANYQAFLAQANKYGNEFNEFLEHYVKYHCQQATAVVTINSALATSAVTNAKTAVQAKRHTY